MVACNQPYETVLMAGSPPEPDPLCLAEGVTNKATIPIGDRPMAWHVLDILCKSGCAARITVVGPRIPLTDGMEHHPIRQIPNHHDIVDNLLAATIDLPDDAHLLIASSDIPLLSPAAVADFCRRAEQSGADLCYSVVERAVMEKCFPGSGRSFRHTREGDFAGGDLFMATPRLFHTHDTLFRQLSGQRKSAWGLVRTLGLGIVLRYATRQLSIAYLEARASKLLAVPCKAIITPYAEIAMDVDKPHQLAMVRRVLASRPNPHD
ncbi:MAG: nucleotidyltransferase family protein [Anaerolineae bacterium]